MKIAYFGFDFFYDCAESILRSGHQIVAIFSHPVDNKRYNFNAKLKELAVRLAVPFTEEKVNIAEMEALRGRGCEMVVCGGYAWRIPIYAHGLPGLNIHPTMLPAGRGPWPLPKMIYESGEAAGVSIHALSSKFDSGDIVMQRSFSISPEDNHEVVATKAQVLAAEICEELFSMPTTQWPRKKQVGGEYWPVPGEAMRELNFEESGATCVKRVKAFGKTGSFAKFLGKEWLVEDAHFWPRSHGKENGMVISSQPGEVVISCRDGYLIITRFEEDPDWVKTNGDNP